jgi:hypothetical protein
MSRMTNGEKVGVYISKTGGWIVMMTIARGKG